MEILGIGPGEFILILIVLLVVVGPERLPQLARQAGSILVRARNWLQTSPDAALVLRARQELEAELASIKASLMEVQSVRDEVLGAARQLEDSVSSITSVKLDINELVNSAGEQTIAPAIGASPPAAAAIQPEQADELVIPDDSPLGIGAEQPTLTEPPSQATSLPSPPATPLGQPAAAPYANGTTPAEPALAELESINVRLQAIMSDLWALQEQLKQRGALDEGWQPPSWNIQLPAPAPEPAAPAEPAPPAPEEDEKVLAARKLLEQLTPMQVNYHAPPAPAPVVQDVPEHDEDPAPENGAPVDPLGAAEETPPAAAKSRKRPKTTLTADTPSTSEGLEAANSQAAAPPPTAEPANRTRAAEAEAIETVATEEAS